MGKTCVTNSFSKVIVFVWTHEDNGFIVSMTIVFLRPHTQMAKIKNEQFNRKHEFWSQKGSVFTVNVL